MWLLTCTLLKSVFVFGIIPDRIFPHSDWIWTRITPNTDTFCAVFLTDFLFLHPLKIWENLSFSSDGFRGCKCLPFYQITKNLQFILTHFRPTFPFNTPWKHQKTIGFPMFSEDVKIWKFSAVFGKSVKS